MGRGWSVAPEHIYRLVLQGSIGIVYYDILSKIIQIIILYLESISNHDGSHEIEPHILELHSWSPEAGLFLQLSIHANRFNTFLKLGSFPCWLQFHADRK